MYEGRSTCWLFDNILTHPESWVWCIDTFEAFDGLPADYETRFDANVESYRNRIYISRQESNRILRNTAPITLSPLYDFAVIDGSHAAKDVLTDAVLVWDLLKSGGVMIFDDYAWTGQGHEHCTEQDKPRLALDAFVEIYQPEILHKGYQLIVRKP